MVKWDIGKEEMKAIVDISIQTSGPLGLPLLNIMMDLAACHCNGCPLDLHAMAAAPLGLQIQDVLSINNNINRISGRLDDKCLPKFAKKGT